MQKCVGIAWLLMWLTTVAVGAQETRGTISGTVRDRDGVLPGAGDRQYICRKVIRRAVRYGRVLGADRLFLNAVVLGPSAP